MMLSQFKENKFIQLTVVSILLILTTACSVSEQSENYDFDSISPLILTQSNHPHGYQKTSCYSCHTPQNIHRVNRLGDPSFDFADPLVQQNGLNSCVGCHGNNGVGL